MALFPIAKPKAHSLTGRITQPLLRGAFQAVKRNRGAAGIDQVSLKMFEANLDENLQALERSLKDGSFCPFPLRRKFIPKEPGKFRPLGIPAVRDRVAQEALRRLLNPIFERLFHDASYGFRQGRNCHQALLKVLELHQAGYQVILDADIQGFFDNLPHEVIMEAVAAQVADGNILRLIQKFLRSGVMEQGVFKPTTVGTPQGGVISPLLANIVLNHLDWKLHEQGYRFVRYADDFVVVCQTQTQAEEALKRVQQTLGDLGLRLSLEKTRITTYRKGYAFLGFVLSRRSRRMRDKSQRKFQEKIRQMTRRCQNLDTELIGKLNQVIQGTARYFATRWSTVRWRFRELDSWIRRRVRCLKFKRFSYHHNRRMRTKQMERLGLLSLESFCLATGVVARPSHVKELRSTNPRGASKHWPETGGVDLWWSPRPGVARSGQAARR
jgi:group II intron reverse transcriptase/maturase